MHMCRNKWQGTGALEYDAEPTVNTFSAYNHGKVEQLVSDTTVSLPYA